MKMRNERLNADKIAAIFEEIAVESNITVKQVQERLFVSSKALDAFIAHAHRVEIEQAKKDEDYQLAESLRGMAAFANQVLDTNLIYIRSKAFITTVITDIDFAPQTNSEKKDLYIFVCESILHDKIVDCDDIHFRKILMQQCKHVLSYAEHIKNKIGFH